MPSWRQVAAYLGAGVLGTAAVGGGAYHALSSQNHSLTQQASQARHSDSSQPSSKGSGSSAIRSVHSPKDVVADIVPHAGQCHLKVMDGGDGVVLPDPNCTPGGVDPAVTQSNIGSTICQTGYTKGVRANTSKTKTASYRWYGISPSQYPKDKTELDHLISLQLGGTNSNSNLWPEPNRTSAKSTTNPKDTVENDLNSLVCAHKVPLALAQEAIASNWPTALQSLGWHHSVSGKLCTNNGTCIPARRHVGSTA